MDSPTEFCNSKRMRIEDDESLSNNFPRKKTCLSHNRGVLSPITEISKNLLFQATIGTPKLKKARKVPNDLECFYDDPEVEHQDSFPQDNEMLCEEPTKKLFNHKMNSLDDFDCNSMDSGFNSNASMCRRSTGTSFLRANSEDSMDDEYMELMALEEELEVQKLPSNLHALMTSSIKTDYSPVLNRVACPKLSSSMRARSLFFEPKTPELLKKADTPKSFKKPDVSRRLENVPEAVLRKCMSMNDAEIMSALSRPTTEEHIGDHSKPYVLPLVKGRHDDLKSITCDTLADLINGEFDDQVASYRILDCRYPYEFNGGHINSAVNWYNQDLILENLVKTESALPKDTEKRNILIFHCEFSSERGPKMSRFLRNYDRNTNEYPTLQFPEIYLLHNGYKEFFESHKDLCDPENYLPMLDPNHVEDLRNFRSKSKCASNVMRLQKSKSRLNL